jgi:hypothetical protein
VIEIPDGTVAVLEASLADLGLKFFGSTANDVIAKINQELIYDGLTIIRSNVNFSGLAFAITGQFSATFQILNQSGQDLEDSDLINQFRDAVTVIGGIVVNAGVDQVISKDASLITASGAAAAIDTSNNPPACGDPNLSFFKNPQQWVSCLTSKGLSTIGLLAIGLLVGIILIVGLERRP